MHLLFVHRNFPAQFGHIADQLINRHGFRCSFATESQDVNSGRTELIPYKVRGGAKRENHPASRGFENATWRSHGVLKAVLSRRDLRPDVIVGHSGFGSTMFLKDRFSAPIVNMCEWFYRPQGNDCDFAHPYGKRDAMSLLDDRCRDALLLADLDACTLAYSPINWQRSQIPREYQHKIETIFDGVDTSLWRPLKLNGRGARKIGGKKLPKTKRIVTYVSRGFESMRGFDIFMQIAQRICELRNDVVSISVRGGEGNDTIDLGPVVPVGGFDNITRIDILGEDGGDDLYGSSHYADSIVGGAGPDSCAGHGGDDSIRGEAGNDSVVAGNGDDLVDGGVGADSIAGEEGADSIAGGDDDDTLYHGTVTLGTGSDTAEDSLWGSDFGDSSSDAGDDIDRNVAVDGDWLNGVDPN